MYYSVFGLQIQADRPIVGLLPIPAPDEVDVLVAMKDERIWQSPLQQESATLWYVSPFYDQHGQPTSEVWKLGGGAYFRIRYNDGIEFILSREGTRVWVRGPSAATPADISLYLLGPILGFLMRLRGITCLHASAVVVNRQALAIMGPGGAGKSTTAAIFARWGYPVLADDVAALQEEGTEFLVLPATPRLCLWPEAVRHLYGSPEALPRLAPQDSIDPGYDKRYQDLTAEGFRYQSEAAPLKAIYLLNDERTAGRTFLEPLSEGEGMVEMIANTYRNELLDKTMRAQEFEALSRLLGKVAVRQVTPHPDPAHILDMCELILNDFHALSLPPISGKAPY